jgi:hypothetical protein
MTASPEPLTAPDCDLRGLEYMPLLGTHLFGSEFNAVANDTEFRVALTLWWKAWTQKPAASLPDDDQALCRLAELGRDMRTWRRVKTVALRGFIKCSDGRLYHRTLSEQANIAWEKRVNDRKRKAEWRARRDAERAGQTELPLSENQELSENSHSPGTRTERGRHAETALNRRDGTGRDVRSKSQAQPSKQISKPEPTREKPRTARDCLNEVAIAAAWSPRTDEQRIEALSVIDGWLASGFDLELDILAGIRAARSRKPEKTRSLKRFTSTIRGKHTDRRGVSLKEDPDALDDAVTRHRTDELVQRTAGSLRVGDG